MLSPYVEVGSFWGSIGNALSSAANAVTSVVKNVNDNPVLSAVAGAVPGFSTVAKIVTAADAAVNKKDVKPALTHLDDNTLAVVLRLTGLDDATIAKVVQLRAAGML